MPVESQYPSPLDQLFLLAVAARRRGLSFDEFWLESVQPGLDGVIRRASFVDCDPPEHLLIWPSDNADRTSWKRAIQFAKPAWEAAYDRRPQTPAEAVLAHLGVALGTQPERELLAA